jgi:hypothetical protein
LIHPAFKRLEAGDDLVGAQCYLCREPFQVGDNPMPIYTGSQQGYAVYAAAHWRCTEKGKAVLAGTETLASNQRVDWFTGDPAGLAEEIEQQMKLGWEVTAMTTLSTAPTHIDRATILVTFRRVP